MAINYLPAELMRIALAELNQASHNHEVWAERFHGALIAHTPPDPQDIDDDAHHKCAFGRWYYHAENRALHQHPGFAGIGIEHEHMHRLAAGLLRQSAAGKPIATGDYQRFIDVRKRLGLEIATVRQEFDQRLNSLDALTEVPSRAGMLTDIRALRELAARDLQTSVLAMMDLDLFKRVNDNYGHATGDKVLIDVAQYAAANLRPYDKVFRYGGEEFLICLVGTNLQAGVGIIDRLRTGLAAIAHVAPGGSVFSVTASFGLALLDPAAPIEYSIEQADRALYVAKGRGRNCLAVSSEADVPAAPSGPAS